jgi:uncharacterized integral membrane protein
MPWRLIGFILLFGIFLFFITVNLDNPCDIYFGFGLKITVPVFLTVFSSFALGMLCTLPFAFGIRKKRKDKAEKDGPAFPPSKPGKKRGRQQDIPELSPLPPAEENVYEVPPAK